ncbi:GNAT family N-acetyltransferase [Ornithinimicrobium cryptoxanthini]|uniref:GNAT family N-acetyltransferase n=1 Tax=Ornithinimicrobium cryptoxanthini TaxID=2934161 RepID=UPI00351C85E2
MWRPGSWRTAWLGETSMRLFAVRKQAIYGWPGGAPQGRPLADVQFERITRSNLLRVGEARADPPTAAFAAAVKSTADIGLFAMKGGRVVGHGWVRKIPGPRRTRPEHIRVPETSCLIRNCYVSLDCRGQGVYRALLVQLALAAASEWPERWILIDTEVSNMASRRGIVGAGFEPVGMVRALQICGRFIIQDWNKA